MKREWTGERLETFITNETMTEHLHRYAIALELADGKNVLDIACGEGYGTWLLSQKASRVTGVDIDEITIEQAKKKYRKDNISFIGGSGLRVPAEDKNFDLVTCFETIEHLDDHQGFLKELKRVLKPGGILIISTPDKKNYTDKSGYKNPHHKKELYEADFRNILKEFFTLAVFFKQEFFCGSLVTDEQHANYQFYSGDYKTIKTGSSDSAMYILAIVSDSNLPVLNSSIFRHPHSISQSQFKEAEAVKSTLTYKAGSILLWPFKMIRNLFKK